MSTSSAPTRRARRFRDSANGRGPLALVCGAALFVFAVYLGAIGVLLPALGRAFGQGPAVEGRLFPANFGGFVVGVLACGALSDRLGRRRVLLGAMLVFTAGLVLAGLARTFGQVSLAFALLGAGGGAMEAVASALAADLFPRRRAAIINALQVAFGAGAALSPLLGQRLLAAGTDWHRLFQGVALASLILSLTLASLPAPVLPSDAGAAPEVSDVAGAGVRAILTQPAFLVLCGCQALYVGAETALSSWMPTYFGHLRGGAAWAGLVVSAFWVAMTVGRAALGNGVAGLPLPRLAGGLALAGAGWAALALLPGSAGLTLACVLGTGLCFSAIFGLILAEAGDRYPRSSGAVFGGVVAAGGVGGAVLPWAVGALAGSSWGWRGALALIPAAALVLGVSLLLLDRSRK